MNCLSAVERLALIAFTVGLDHGNVINYYCYDWLRYLMVDGKSTLLFTGQQRNHACTHWNVRAHNVAIVVSVVRFKYGNSNTLYVCTLMWLDKANEFRWRTTSQTKHYLNVRHVGFANVLTTLFMHGAWSKPRKRRRSKEKTNTAMAIASTSLLNIWISLWQF